MKAPLVRRLRSLEGSGYITFENNPLSRVWRLDM